MSRTNRTPDEVILDALQNELNGITDRIEQTDRLIETWERTRKAAQQQIKSANMWISKYSKEQQTLKMSLISFQERLNLLKEK